MMVLITGAAGGLGRAFAIECARRGFDLVLTDIDSGGLNAISEGVRRQYDVNVLVCPCDITDKDAVDAMFRSVRERNIRFDMLLNVAGVDYEGGFLTRDSDRISRIVSLNVEATLRMTHTALFHRRRNGAFHVVFVSSLASLYPMPLKATYAASKRFLLDFSIALGRELKSERVHVLALCPGGLATTREAVRGIDAQGFWGSVTTNRLEAVARKTISKSLRGRSIYVPGLVNRVFSAAGKFVPAGLVANLLYRRWRSAQRAWLPAKPSEPCKN